MQTVLASCPEETFLEQFSQNLNAMSVVALRDLLLFERSYTENIKLLPIPSKLTQLIYEFGSLSATRLTWFFIG
jgi:hypothetical protein